MKGNSQKRKWGGRERKEGITEQDAVAATIIYL
jgi:hypothetical protein